MLEGVLTGLLFALGATVLNSVAALLQSDATRRVSAHRSLIAQPRYLGGLGVDALGWACTVVALRQLPVFAVQAVLGGSIAVTAILARMFYGSTLRTVDRVAIVACVLGLVLVAGSAGAGPPPVVSVTTDVVLATAAVVLAVVAVWLWRRGRAWPLAVVAGLAFGATSLAVRAVHVQGGGMVELVTQPGPYLVVGFWAVGMSSYSRALTLGSLARVTAVFLVTEVVVPGLVGIALLGDSVRAGWWVPMAIGLLLAVGGVAVLAGSPAHQSPRPSLVA
jgi:drug/metabolite transporter (DMT)-like permease